MLELWRSHTLNIPGILLFLKELSYLENTPFVIDRLM